MGDFPTLDPFSGIYDLDKSLVDEGFLDRKGSLSIGITNQTNPIAVHKITTDDPLGDTEFIVDKVEAKANAGVSGVSFIGSQGSVGFKASGDVFAELAVFPDPTSQSFADALGPVASTKFSLAGDAALTAVMLRWGADASATASGSIALGAGVGTIDFNAGGSGELYFAVVQQTPRMTLTDTALTNVVKSWKLPVHVRTADDLAPRTHLLSEVGGSLTAKIDATFGHEFNWIRQVTLLEPRVGAPAGTSTLSGDIGLKLQLGLTASFGLTTQGKYAVVVSRETEASVIRIRIYKMRLNDFDFALSASAAATATVPESLLPGKFEDLLKATLGIHALQILNELEDPNTIENWIKKFGPAYVGDLFKKITGMDLAAAILKINDLASRWKNLPSSAVGLFEKMAEKGIPDFSDIKAAAALVAAKDTTALKALLESKIAELKSPFLESPLGQYLEGLGEQGALSLLQNIPDAVAQAAQKTVDFLNGAPIEELLNKIVGEIDSRLKVDTILQDLQGDPATVLDKLLFDRLTAFLNRQQPAVEDIKKLQAAIKALQGKVGTLYEKTIKALNSTYKAQFNATYQQASTDTALIDASFSFDGDGAQNAGVAASMKQLLGGDLDDFLTTPRAGVTLASGALTHQVKRHSHVDFTLPVLKTEGDWVSTAMTSFNAVDQSNGRLALYKLDQVGQEIQKSTFTSLWTGRNWRSITVSVTGQISALLPRGMGLRVHSGVPADLQRAASTTSSIRMEVQNLTLKSLESNIEPFATQLMRRVFPDHAAFEKWAKTGQVLANPGNTLVSLDVALPDQAPLAWLGVTAEGKTDPIYMQLSLQLQLLLRAYLARSYFQSTDRFETVDTAYLVLLYAALPRTNALPPDKDVYFDFRDKNQVMRVAQTALTNGRFAEQLAQAQVRLKSEQRDGLAGFYDPDLADKFFNTATNDTNLHLLQDSLLFVEANTIFDARDAGLNAAKFNKLVAANRPMEALNALADFGNKLVSAFNHDLSSVFVEQNDALQRLSPLILAQAASVFDSSVPVGSFDSTLNVTVLRGGAAMPADFPDFTADPKDIVVSLNAASFAGLN
jgi:hypothetical protein